MTALGRNRGRSSMRTVKSWTMTLAALGCIACLTACQRDYRFDTMARYEAPVGRFDVLVHAMGLVRAGHDLSEDSRADVTIAPLASSTGAAIHLQVILPHTLSYQVEGHGSHTGEWDAGSDEDIGDLLHEYGYKGTKQEWSEVQQAVEGALAGPKATLMQGQTKALRVLEVKFR